jgi:glycosyltransferase involved in cell wall biosynthesis
MHDEAPVLDGLLRDLGAAFAGFEGGWELIAVDDGSRDRTWHEIKARAHEFPWLRGVRLAGRHGQHPATMAGLSEARGRVIAVMDADRQVGAAAMRGVVEEVISGADLAFAVRDHSRDGLLRRTLGAAVHSFLARRSAGAPPRALSTFLACRREVVEQVLYRIVGRPVTPFHLMLARPRRVVWLETENAPRAGGRSKYNLRRLARLSGDVFFGYTDLPEKVSASVPAMAGGTAALWGLGLLSSVAGRPEIARAVFPLGALWLLAFSALILAAAAGRVTRSVATGPFYCVTETL